MVVFYFLYTFVLVQQLKHGLTINNLGMSIYLEFPMIAEYPIYGSPFKNDEQQFFSEEDALKEIKEEKEVLQDFLLLKTV